MNEDFTNLPYKERFTISLITSGSIKLQLNDSPVKNVAPIIICLSMYDKVKVLEKHNIYSQSFSFHSDFFNTARFLESKGYLSTSLKIESGLSLFKREKK